MIRVHDATIMARCSGGVDRHPASGNGPLEQGEYGGRHQARPAASRSSARSRAGCPDHNALRNPFLPP